MADQPNDEALEQNLEKLLARGTQLPRLSAERRAQMLDALKTCQARLQQPKEKTMESTSPFRRVRPWLASAAAVVLVVAGWLLLGPRPAPLKEDVGPDQPFRTVEVARGIERTVLADGTIVIARKGSKYAVEGKRSLSLDKGDLYLIVARAAEPFVVRTAHGRAAAKGTRFGISAGATTTQVAVAQGVVALANAQGQINVAAGQEGELVAAARPVRRPAPRISYLVSWAKDALGKPSPLVEKKPHDTGELVAKDPWGQEVKLTLRRYHVDVFIDNGIARTTIDQTYFNHLPWQIEGTFYFPLPPDASVSRLAMYVGGTLNEGGMVSRERGQQIYTHIKFQRRDPALLEMQEGNVFKMRIFPIEGRQEKRVFLSYTQKLSELYGTLRYWFPMDHTHGNAREVTVHVRIKGAAGTYTAESSTHEFGINEHNGDLVMNYRAKDVKPDQDVLLHLVPTKDAPRRAFATYQKNGQSYVFGRITPNLPRTLGAVRPRQWIVINDVSASRSKLDVQAQAYILLRLIEEADDGDALGLINLNTKARVKSTRLVPVRDPEAKDLATAAQVRVRLGATNLAAGLEAAAKLIETSKADNPHILYLGDGVATDGQTAVDALLDRLPDGATFVGIGVGKKADMNFLQAAADETGGLFALINPDDDIDWRVFDLIASLNTPRLVGLKTRFLTAAGEPATIAAYPSARALADGETFFVVGCTNRQVPAWLEIEGTVGGEAFKRRYDLSGAEPDGAFIPRFWAKRHIDELLKSGPEHKNEIVKLSKQYYVMTPYTSLIVLENDKMYEEFKVERGRSDHWALYPAPKTIQVVKEPLKRHPWSWWSGYYDSEDEKVKAKARPKSVKDIVESVQFRINAPFYYWRPQRRGQGRFALYDLLDSGTNPTGLMTRLFTLRVPGPDGAAPGKAATAPRGPVAAGKPMLPMILAEPSGEMLPSVFLRRSGRMRGNFGYMPVLKTYIRPLRGERLGGDLWFGETLPLATLPGELEGLVGDLMLTGGDEYLGTESGLLMPGSKYDLGWLGDVSGRFLGTSINGPVERGQSLRSTGFLLEIENELRPPPVLIDRWRSSHEWLPAALYTGLPSSGLAAGTMGGELSPQLYAAFAQAAGTRYSRIRRDIENFNRQFGGWWDDGGGWSTTWGWNQLDLRKSRGARWYGGLEGLENGERPAPTDIPVAGDDPMELPPLPQLVAGGKWERYPAVAVAFYGKAIKTVPGTASALAADFVVARRDELLEKERSKTEDKELARIRAALANVEAAYPQFEDAGVFWRPQGWNYRPRPWTFQPPQVQCHQFYNWSFDLTRYAAGLYSTTFDMLNLVAEAYPMRAVGTVSDEAKALIDAARKAMRPVQVRLQRKPPAGSQPAGGSRAMLVAAGDRFAFTHKTNMYLEERMVCDGEAVYHVYPELGLAARRDATSLRLASLRSIVPHLLKPAEWLARRYVVALAEKTAERFVLKLTPAVRVPKGKKAPEPAFHVLVAVAPDGRILEKTLNVNLPQVRNLREGPVNGNLPQVRNLREGPVHKTRLKLTFVYGGAKITAKWHDAKGKELASASLFAEPFTPKADTFAVDRKALVVFDMPLRRPSHYAAKVAEMAKAKDADAAALVRLKRHLALAHLQELRWRRWGGSNSPAYKALDEGFKPSKTGAKPLLGDVTLVGAAGYRNNVPGWAERAGVPKANPVVAYFTQMRSGWQGMAKIRDQHPGGLTGHLAAYHATLAGGAQAKAEQLDKLLKDYERSPLLLAAVFYRSQWGRKPEEWFRLFEPFMKTRWRSLAILMAAQYAKTAEHKKRIAEAFADLHKKVTEKGFEMPVTPQMCSLLRGADGGKHWQTVIRGALKVATDADRAAPLLRFAELAFRSGEREMALAAVKSATKLVKEPDSVRAKLTVAQVYWAGSQLKDALALYDEIFAALETKGVPPSPALLAAAARLAQQAGQPGRAIDLEERALAAEHPHLPELINLRAFRQRYQWLWRQYQAKVQQAASKKDAAAVAHWLARAERTWARWYEVDADNAALVRQMATLQATIGRTDDAWLYLSSLIDAKPRDAQSHYNVGQWYRGRGDKSQAEQWYARAYEWDTANPRWLLERGRLLREMGRKDDARRVFQQVIDGKWAPGLQGSVRQAKKEIGK